MVLNFWLFWTQFNTISSILEKVWRIISVCLRVKIETSADSSFFPFFGTATPTQLLIFAGKEENFSYHLYKDKLSHLSILATTTLSLLTMSSECQSSPTDNDSLLNEWIIHSKSLASLWLSVIVPEIASSWKIQGNAYLTPR